MPALLERPCLDGCSCRGTLEQIFEIVIVILVESGNRCLLPGPLRLSVNVLVLSAVRGFDRQRSDKEEHVQDFRQVEEIVEPVQRRKSFRQGGNRAGQGGDSHIDR